MRYTKYFILLINIYGTTYINLDRCKPENFKKVLDSNKIKKLEISLSPKSYKSSAFKSSKMKEFTKFLTENKKEIENFTIIYDTSSLKDREKKELEIEINKSTQEIQRFCKVSSANLKEKKHNNIPLQTDLIGQYTTPDRIISVSSVPVSSLLMEHDISFETQEDKKELITQASLYTVSENLSSTMKEEKYEEIITLENEFFKDSPFSLQFNKKRGTSKLNTLYLNINEYLSIFKSILHKMGIYQPFIVDGPKDKCEKLTINNQHNMTHNDFDTIIKNKKIQEYCKYNEIEISIPKEYEDDKKIYKFLEKINTKNKAEITINVKDMFVLINLLSHINDSNNLNSNIHMKILNCNIEYSKEHVDNFRLLWGFMDTAHKNKKIQQLNINLIGNMTKEQETEQLQCIEELNRKYI